MLIRGGIADRPWGMTLGAFARREVSGILTIRSAASSTCVLFESGHVIGSSESGVPQLDDDALRRQATITTVGHTFGLTEGDFVLTAEVELSMRPHAPIHVGGLIHHGAQLYVGEQRLQLTLFELGARFRLRLDQLDDVAYYGFGAPEMQVVHHLSTGLSITEIDAMAGADRMIALATIYTLLSLGGIEVDSGPRLARGTQTPIPGTQRLARPSQPPPLRPKQPAPPAQLTPTQHAAVAYRRAQAALRDERIDDAVRELERAMALVPDQLDYRSTLIWAKFVGSRDKAAIANATRAALGQILIKSERPVLPRYYLGMVERILGRTTQALEHFQEVLELDPNHTEASTEIRYLSRRR